jgi:crotonobetainyl-CoA:carnitine CoA-transferase CaiB-like acyl-CoA transferase
MVAPAPPRVLDTTSGIAGAYAALLLHQAGADVVRRSTAGDDPQLPDGSPLAAYLRQGQRRVAATDDPPASALGADVLLATPSAADRDVLVAIREADPGVVVVAITPYGLEGPYADRPASDLTLQADSGALAIRGNAGEEPIQMGGRTIQWLAGAYAAAAASAMWRGRRSGGSGALVDLSLAEVANTGAANFMDVFLAVEFGIDGEPVTPPRVFETPSIERTADGWVGFNTNAPHQVTAFLRMMGRDDLADSGEWMMAASRIERIDEWQAMVTEWTSARTTDEIVAAAVAHHVPVAPVADGRSVAELDHVVARRSLAPQPGGRAVVPRRPWRFDGELPPGPDPVPDVDDVGPADRPVWVEREAEPPPGPDAPPGSSRPRPLEGLRVLDLTTWWAGPAATGLLAALGADVVHIEGPDRMDGVRLVGMMFADRPQWWERSPFFLAVDVDKRDLAVDLLSARGRALMLDLVREVDVVVENSTPHVLDKLDLGWEVVHATNPAAILVRMPAFGLDGPWRERPGFAQNIEQASGLAWLTGQADDQPRIQRGPCDPNGGAHAAIALLAALDRRDDTGLGSLVEVALFDAALALASEAIVEWSANGVLLGRDGNRSPFAAPQGVYRAEGDDAWLALSVETDGQWRALAAVVGRDDLESDPALADHDGRRADHDRLDGALAEWVAARDLDAAVELLVEAGVPAAPARDPRLTYRHPQFRARGYQQLVDHPVIGPLPVPTLPFRVDGIDRWVRRPAPTFGQHNDDVLSDLLGLTPTELASLRADGTIADRPTNV